MLAWLAVVPARQATLIASSAREFKRSEPPRRSLLSRLLAQRILQHLQPEEGLEPVQEPAALAHLNRSASPQLVLCLAPECGPCDLLVLTLLHRRQPTGPTHDPYRAVVERWARPAAHYLRPPSVPTAAEAVAAGARRGGNAGALTAAVDAFRSLLQPQLHTDPHDWSLLWRQELPGTAEQIAIAADGASMAVAYQRLVEEGMRHTVRLWQLQRPHEAAHPSWQCAAPGAAAGAAAAGAAAADTGVAAGAPPPWEDIALRGSTHVSALSLVGGLARDECLVYARGLDRYAFRMLCRPRPRSHRRGARRWLRRWGPWRSAWRGMRPGPVVDRRRGYTETVMLRGLTLPQQPGLGPLLVGQLSPSGIGSVRYGLGLSLQLYSPVRLPRPCGLLARLRRSARCSEAAWTLRAATASHLPRAAAAAAAEPTDPAHVPRPLVAGSVDGSHAVVAFAHTITTLHATATRPPEVPVAAVGEAGEAGVAGEPRMSVEAGVGADAAGGGASAGESWAATEGRPPAEGGATASPTLPPLADADEEEAAAGGGEAGRDGARGQELRARRSVQGHRTKRRARTRARRQRRGAARQAEAEAAVGGGVAEEGGGGGSGGSGSGTGGGGGGGGASAVLLEVQIEGIASSFKLIAHARTGGQLALLISSRELLLLSQNDPPQPEPGLSPTPSPAPPPVPSAAAASAAGTAPATSLPAVGRPRKDAPPPVDSPVEAAAAAPSGAAPSAATGPASPSPAAASSGWQSPSAPDTPLPYGAAAPNTPQACDAGAEAEARASSLGPDTPATAPHSVAQPPRGGWWRVPWRGARRALGGGWRRGAAPHDAPTLTPTPTPTPTLTSTPPIAPPPTLTPPPPTLPASAPATSPPSPGAPARAIWPDVHAPTPEAEAGGGVEPQPEPSPPAGAAGAEGAGSAPGGAHAPAWTGANGATLANDSALSEYEVDRWRLESATLPRLEPQGKAEPIATALLPVAPGEAGLLLVLYEGGGIATFNLTGALTPSAEYASQALWSGGSGAGDALSTSLLTMALVSLLLGLALLCIGARFGLPVAPTGSWALRPMAWLRTSLRFVAELALAPALAATLLIWPDLQWAPLEEPPEPRPNRAAATPAAAAPPGAATPGATTPAAAQAAASATEGFTPTVGAAAAAYIAAATAAGVDIAAADDDDVDIAAAAAAAATATASLIVAATTPTASVAPMPAAAQPFEPYEPTGPVPGIGAVPGTMAHAANIANAATYAAYAADARRLLNGSAVVLGTSPHNVVAPSQLQPQQLGRPAAVAATASIAAPFGPTTAAFAAANAASSATGAEPATSMLRPPLHSGLHHTCAPGSSSTAHVSPAPAFRFTPYAPPPAPASAALAPPDSEDTEVVD